MSRSPAARRSGAPHPAVRCAGAPRAAARCAGISSAGVLALLIGLALPSTAAGQASADSPSQQPLPPSAQPQRAPPPAGRQPAQPQPAPPPARRPPAPAPLRLGLRGYVTFGQATLAAADTFDAVAGTHSRPAYGGGVHVTNIWKRVFADVGASALALDGERVFVSGGQVFELGIPLEVTMRSVDLAGGWRFTLARGRVSPYAGAGVSYLRYEETADFAQRGDDVRESKAGALVLGGVDVQVWRWIHAGGELRYRRVRGILGDGGASEAFGEKDAGGLALGMRIAIGR